MNVCMNLSTTFRLKDELNIYRSLTKVDRTTFNFDVDKVSFSDCHWCDKILFVSSKIEWHEALDKYLKGIRKFVLEDDSKILIARTKLRRWATATLTCPKLLTNTFRLYLLDCSVKALIHLALFGGFGVNCKIMR